MNGPRITIRGLLVLVAACGLASACFRWLAPFLLYTVGGWASFLVAGFGLSRASGWKVGRGGRRTLTAVCLMLVVLSLYSVWTFQRASSYACASQDAALPYPDRVVNAFERWLNTRRPPPPGSLKLHGEYPLVFFLLGLSVAAFMALLGFGLGPLLTDRSGSSGDELLENDGVKT